MSSRVLVVMSVLMLVLALSPVSSASARDRTDMLRNQATVLDNDGDTLANDIDPDDDNDGVADFSDPDPFNAAIPRAGVTPPPNPDASDEDSDGDTIPNDIDPDDNSGGAAPPPPPVAVEPSPTPPVVQAPVNAGPPDDPGQQAPVAEAPEPQVYQAPVVTGLPSTGHLGATVMNDWLAALMISVIALTTIAVHTWARTRR